MNSLELPVSHGEAFDKLSILEIKLQYIQDTRKKDVQTEYTLLYDKLKELFNSNIKYHYRILKNINETIWKQQDKFRISESPEEKSELCMQIIDENDRRFRVKSKINKLFESSLQEQKGYTKKNALFCGHLGLGDMITCLPIIRYLSTIYDKVIVICNEKYIENCKYFYLDDPSIILYPHTNKIYDIIESLFTNPEFKIYLCGASQFNKETEDIKVYDLPFSFFDDCNIDYSIFWDYFHIPRYIDSIELYSLVKDIPYCFIHNNANFNETFTTEFVETYLSIDRNTTLLLNVNRNIYPKEHKWHSIAEEFINKPIAFYKDTMENANFIFLTDSCFFCMGIQLEFKTDKLFVISSYPDYSYFYSEKYKYNKNSSYTKFNCIISVEKMKKLSDDKVSIKYLTNDNVYEEILLDLPLKVTKVQLPNCVGREKEVLLVC